MKAFYQIIFLITIVLSCSNDNDNSLDTKTDLLIDVQWFHSETIGISPSGYAAVSPIVFKRDKKVNIGGSEAEWAFIDNGGSIKITYPNSNYSNKYEIINLIDTEFHFKHYDGNGNFVVELKYSKCNPISFGGC